LGVIIHCRGEVIVAEPIVKEELIKFVDIESLPAGILHFSLVDRATKSVLSQRICFVKKDERDHITLSMEKERYGQREEVEIGIRVSDASGAPVDGDFALSVTDGSSVEIDPMSQNIVSYLLMSSDIRGYIEDPGYYFSGNSRQITNNLDLVVMTQGWTRFHISNILKNTLSECRYEYESSQYFKGTIKGAFGYWAREPSLMVVNSVSKDIDIFELDNGGPFRIAGFDYTDSTSFLIQARGRNGNLVSLSLNMEPFTFKNNII